MDELVAHTSDLDLTEKDIAGLGSVDAVASFFTKLGYDTSDRAVLTPEAIGLSGDSAKALKRVELLAEDSEQFLRVVFAQPKSLTAKVRTDLARVLGKSTIDHILVLSPDFDSLEFVFLDKRRKESKGPAGIERVQVVPKTFSLDRRRPSRLDLRTLRRFTWTCRDALDQFDKLRSVFEAAAYTGEYFQNRGLFSDYFLRERLRNDRAWQDDNPSEAFIFVRDLMQEAQRRWSEKEEAVVRKELYEPVFERLGFKAKVNRPATSDHTKPDYLLRDTSGKNVTAAFVYPWERWLDGPDFNDPHTPDENPGACVVTALDDGLADWIIVTNGRQWRLYGRKAHARSTNFYEVDLVEALTDPNEAFRYWWLFFRPEAFSPAEDDEGCWLDNILQGSRDYAKRLGDRLKDRVFFTIFPHMAQGFLEDRKQRLGVKKAPTREELDEVFEATLTLLYRLLFLLFAESRDLLPIREAPYQAASLKKIKEEIAEKAGVSESEVADALKKAYSPKETGLYDRLGDLCQVLANGESVLNVPKYNGGLFNVEPKDMEKRDERIAQFLLDHKIPDRHLALAIDRLARDQDERTLGLVFIDYKSLEVRHLGSIYEGLLEFKLKIAEEDLTTKTSKGAEKYVSLSQASGRRRRQPDVVVRKNDVYLSNDKAERKASGSYYTPDDIVEYIVANTVGPVLEEKLETLRPEFRKVRKTFDNELKKSEAYPSPDVRNGKVDHRQWATQQTYNHHKELVEKLFDFKACDPAMGSGHFLVEVVDFVTDRLVKFLNQFPINPVNFALERTRDSILESLGEQGVTVDPASLTNINLLKRFVLKRCVYGVDLNPMAVELAKVSLWLDCFTLGAPLNFLDHHLRCGNSLVGATFKDLEDATKGRLFSLDYEPLLRAINHVLQVSRLADATAADVAQSMKQYDTARKALTGYQVILDLLVAKHFGFPGAPGIVEEGEDIKFDDKQRFLASLHDDDERELVGQVGKVARQRDRRFFHWEIEFPEIFFGVVGASGQQLKHKNRINKGSAGFDCVVGNPPYVRVEFLESDLKRYLKQQFSSVVDRCDIYTAFIELSRRLLRTDRFSGMIVSSQFLNTDYGTPLRTLLKQEQALTRLIDLSPLQVFEGALTYPAIVICASSPQPSIDVLSMEQFTTTSRGVAHDMILFTQHCNDISEVSADTFYNFDVWSALRASGSQSISLESLTGVTLQELCNISSSMKSGRDQVLVGKLLEENAECFAISLRSEDDSLSVHRSLWRKVIRPKDLRDNGTIAMESHVVFWPYVDDPASDEFVLKTESEIADECAVTYHYLRKHIEALKNRRDSGKTWEEHGRAWYSLGRIGKPSDYMQPKLLSPGEFIKPRFLLDNSDSLFPCARIIGISSCVVNCEALSKYLTSSWSESWFRTNLPAKGGGYRGMSVGDLGRIPVPESGNKVWNEIEQASSDQEVDDAIEAWLTEAVEASNDTTSGVSTNA